MDFLGNIWIWIAAAAIWLSPNARTFAGNCLQGAGRIFRGMGRFGRGFIAWTQPILLLVLFLIFISILVGPELSQIIKITAIYAMIVWTMIMWITLAISSTLVNATFSTLLPDQQEAIANALKRPYRILAIVIAILVAWGLQVFVWPGMPMKIGAFITLFIIGMVMVDVVRKKEATLAFARFWFIVALVIFIVESIFFYAKPWVEHSNSWPAVKIRNALDKEKEAALIDSLDTETEYPMIMLKSEGKPIIVTPKGLDVADYNKALAEIVGQKVYLLATGNNIDEVVRTRFGHKKCMLIETEVSRANPIAHQYVVPVDFLDKTKKQKPKNPPVTWRESISGRAGTANWLPTGGQPTLKKRVDQIFKIETTDPLLASWKWKFSNEMTWRDMNSEAPIPSGAVKVNMQGPHNNRGSGELIFYVTY